MQTYDVIVLGGGTAGTAAARAASEAGARTVMFNDGELGGLCILRGCMPTKTMLHAAHLVHEARHHRTPGIGHADLEIDFAAVMANKDAKVARFKAAKIASIENAGYTVIDARARFVGPDTVEAGGEIYRFEKGAVIATGSVARVMDIDGLEGVPYLTSDEVMELTERPESMVVIGTGAIGLEFAQFFARMGTAVSLLSRRPVLWRIDSDISEEMARVLADEPNLDLLCPARPTRVQADSDGLRVEVDIDGEQRTIRAERLLMATGRRAAIDGLGLEAAGIAVKNGRVICGDDMRTTHPRVFVAGDASGERLLLHVANQEGRVAGLGAAQAPGEHRVDRRLHLEVVFTDPAVACLGRNRQQAGPEALTASARLAETGRAITMDVQHGLWKVVADRSGEILGTQILGPRADDLVHVLVPVLYHHGTASDLLEMPWYHPTLSEVLLGLARDLQAQVTTS